MVRLNWGHVVEQLVKSRKRRRGLQRRRREVSLVPACIAELEPRWLMSGPTAVNDSYSVVHDHTRATGDSVLDNDTGGGSGGGSLTAVLVGGVSHGSLTLNSDGTFSYTPSSHFAGSDSFTYKDFDGTNYGNTATVSLSVTNIAPTTTADTYIIYKDSYDTAAEGVDGVLANDFDYNSDSMTASVVTGPSHGSLTLHSDGSFIYTPTAGYLGSDSFTYAATDGIATTNQSVSLTVTSPFNAQGNAVDNPFVAAAPSGSFTVSPLTGELQATYSLGQGHDLVYSSLTADVKPIVAVETSMHVDDFSPPTTVEVQLTYGGITATPVFFTTSGLVTGMNLRLAVQVNANSLATGHYQYTMTVIGHYGSTTSTRVFTGYQDIVNRAGSEFGPGWNLAELDKLSIGTGGVMWVGGQTGTAWFTDTGSGTYSSPAGPLAFHTLVKNGGGTYTLTDKFGNKENFSSTGLLTSKVDRNGNTTSYSYDGSGRLTGITDPFSRTTTFNLTSGKVSSVVDIASRTTTIGRDGSSRITSITAPDPDGAGALAAPVMGYAYDSSNRMTSLTDPLSHATSFSFDFAGRVSAATYPDSTATGFAAAQEAGLVNPASGTGTSGSPASPYITQFAYGYITDELSHQHIATFDRFGNPLISTSALGFTTTVVRNANGQITQMTQPDPDGAGALAAPVTSYTYDAKGNVTQITYPDSSYETWTYHSTLNVPLTHTDQRGHTTTNTYDSHGNLLTVTDPLSNVTTNTYNANGTLATVTGADPDGAGALTAPVTSYTYDSYARVTRITNPDSTHKDFTYNTSNTVATSADELGNTTTNAYDNLDRLTSVTLPDPDGVGALSSPVTSYTYDAASRKTTMTDALGKVTTYAYDTRDRLTSVTAPDPDGAGALSAPVTSYGYDAAGRQTSVTDPLGYVTTNTYDDDGRLTAVTQPDPDGAGALTSPTTHYLYDNLGRKTRMTDPRNNHVDYAYNSLNQLTSVTDALGKATSYTYDAMGNKLTETLPDPDGAGALTAPVTTYTYDDDNKVATVTDALGNVTTNAYDHLERLITVTQPDPDGAGALTAPVTTYTYDVNSRQTRITNALGYYTQTAYDNAGRRTSVTAPDPDGAGALSAPVTSYAYDNDGRLVTDTDPLSHTTTYTYNANGDKLTVTDHLGNVTTYAYDYDRRLISVTAPDPDGAGSLTAPVTTYVYDAAGHKTSQTDPDPDGAGALSSPVTTFSYDHIGRLISMTDALSHTTSYEYDANGNKTTTTDALGKVTTNAYDANNRLTSVTAPDPDGAGALTAAVTSYGYDYIGRQIAVTDPLTGVTHYAFDADGNLSSIQDPGGNTTTYTYDHLNRKIGETNANSATRTFVYDAIGELTSVTDRNSRTTNLTYDHMGRLTQEDWMSGGSSIRTFTYVYDAASRLTSASDPDSAYAYSYDTANRVTSVDNNGTPNMPRVVLGSTYDNLGRRISLAATVAGTQDFINSYVYDTLGRETQVKQQAQTGTGVNPVASKRIDFTYDAANNAATISRYADLTGTNLVASSTFTFDSDNRLTNLSHDKGGTNLASYTWTYDAASRLTGTSSNDGTDSFTYDTAGQVTAASHSYQTNESYSYDADGNRTNTGYSTTTNNRLSSDGTFNYTYDAEGNRTRKTTISSGAYVDYTWDYHNRLTDVTFKTSGGTTTSKVHYVYDVYDRLIGKQVDTNGDGTYDTAARYAYDDNSTAPGLGRGGAGGLPSAVSSNIVLVYNGSSSLTNRYLNGPGVDQTMADENGSGTVRWELADNQGTIRDVAQYNSGTNTTTVVNHLKYDAFGNITSQSDATKTPLFTYTGRQWDADSGLLYYRARWYDPKVGRFIGEDPAGFGGGDVNLSRYVHNRPVTLADPSGLSEFLNGILGSSGYTPSDPASYDPLGLWQEPKRNYPTSFLGQFDNLDDKVKQIPTNMWGVVKSNIAAFNGILDDVGDYFEQFKDPAKREYYIKTRFIGTELEGFRWNGDGIDKKFYTPFQIDTLEGNLFGNASFDVLGPTSGNWGLTTRAELRQSIGNGNWDALLYFNKDKGSDLFTFSAEGGFNTQLGNNTDLAVRLAYGDAPTRGVGVPTVWTQDPTMRQQSLSGYLVVKGNNFQFFGTTDYDWRQWNFSGGGSYFNASPTKPIGASISFGVQQGQHSVVETFLGQFEARW